MRVAEGEVTHLVVKYKGQKSDIAPFVFFFNTLMSKSHMIVQNLCTSVRSCTESMNEIITL